MKNLLETVFPIMIFYSLVSFFIFPTIGYYLTKKIEGITYGILFGCLASITMWQYFGKKMVK